MNSPELDCGSADDILAEVRRIKEELAAASGYDVHKMLDDARRDQAKSGRRILSPPKRVDVKFQEVSEQVVAKNADLYQRLS